MKKTVALKPEAAERIKQAVQEAIAEVMKRFYGRVPTYDVLEECASEIRKAVEEPLLKDLPQDAKRLAEEFKVRTNGFQIVVDVPVELLRLMGLAS